MNPISPSSSSASASHPVMPPAPHHNSTEIEIAECVKECQQLFLRTTLRSTDRAQQPLIQIWTVISQNEVLSDKIINLVEKVTPLLFFYQVAFSHLSPLSDRDDSLAPKNELHSAKHNPIYSELTSSQAHNISSHEEHNVPLDRVGESYKTTINKIIAKINREIQSEINSTVVNQGHQHNNTSSSSASHAENRREKEIHADNTRLSLSTCKSPSQQDLNAAFRNAVNEDKTLLNLYLKWALPSQKTSVPTTSKTTVGIKMRIRELLVKYDILLAEHNNYGKGCEEQQLQDLVEKLQQMELNYNKDVLIVIERTVKKRIAEAVKNNKVPSQKNQFHSAIPLLDTGKYDLLFTILRKGTNYVETGF